MYVFIFVTHVRSGITTEYTQCSKLQTAGSQTGGKMVLGITRGLGILGCLGSFTLECHVSCGRQLGQDLRVQFLNRIHSSTHTAYGYQRRFIPERVEPPSGVLHFITSCVRLTVEKGPQSQVSSRGFYIQVIPSRGAWPDLPQGAFFFLYTKFMSLCFYIHRT